jgi:hypothetical protein
VGELGDGLFTVAGGFVSSGFTRFRRGLDKPVGFEICFLAIVLLQMISFH